MSTDALIVNAVCELQRHGNTHAEACRLVRAWLAEHDRALAAQVGEQIAAAVMEMDSPPSVNEALVSRLHVATLAREAVR